MEFLGALQTQLNTTFQKFSEWVDKAKHVPEAVMVRQSSGVEVPEHITTVVAKMLLAVQAVMKRHHSNSSAFEDVESEEGKVPRLGTNLGLFIFTTVLCIKCHTEVIFGTEAKTLKLDKLHHGKL